jgi:formylglycine-generating enzyme required for sulfatase activity
VYKESVGAQKVRSETPTDRSNLPVVYVDWNNAIAYARWLEGELKNDGPVEIRRLLNEG